MDPVCIISGAGEYYGHAIRPGPADYVIAADGGYLRLRDMGVRIDEVIGDFDSAGFVPDHPRVRRLPVEKDDTDMLYALRVGVGLGFRTFRLYGGAGGRLDHTLANIQCLAWLAAQGKRGYLYGDGQIITALRGDSIAFAARESGVLSVFALGGEASGVTIEGLKYTACGICLTPVFPLGVSNEFVGLPASIEGAEGTIAVCFPDDAVVL